MDNPTETFEAVNDSLQAAGVDDETRHRTLEKLALSMIDDWPDADECAALYGDDPVVGPIFQELGLFVELTGIVEIKLYVHDTAEEGYGYALEDEVSWPEDDDRYRLNRMLYEVELNVEVDRSTGASRIVGVHGTRLTEPRPWNGTPAAQ